MLNKISIQIWTMRKLCFIFCLLNWKLNSICFSCAKVRLKFLLNRSCQKSRTESEFWSISMRHPINSDWLLANLAGKVYEISLSSTKWLWKNIACSRKKNWKHGFGIIINLLIELFPRNSNYIPHFNPDHNRIFVFILLITVNSVSLQSPLSITDQY